MQASCKRLKKKNNLEGFVTFTPLSPSLKKKKLSLGSRPDGWYVKLIPHLKACSTWHARSHLQRDSGAGEPFIPKPVWFYRPSPCLRLWCSFCEIQGNIHGLVLAAGRHSSAKNITHYCEQPAVCHIRSGGTLPTAVQAASGCYNTAAAVTHRKWLGFVWVGVRPVWLNWARVCASEWGFLHTWGCQMLPKPPDSWASCSCRRSKAAKSPLSPLCFGSNAEIMCSSPVFNQECVRNVQRIETHTLGQLCFCQIVQL